MFTIEQSPFLHALGYAIGHSLWQMSLLWLVYFGAIHVGKWSSNRKYALAVGTSLAGLLWFVGTLLYYANSVQINNDSAATTGMLQAMPESVSSSKNLLFIYNSTLATLRSLAPYLSCAYLVVMLVLSIRLANGFNQVKQLRTRGLSKPAVDWRLFVKDHASLLGIKKPVQVFISTIASSPLTIGFWRPLILIPLASINQLSPQQMEAVLLHELAHIRRHDYLLNIILQLAEITLFFNPFMRLLLKQARQERENSCDDWVLQFRYNAADYARALLAIEQSSTQSLLALGSNSNNEFQLLNRVKRMVAPERQSFNYRQQLGLLFLITILSLGFTIVSPRPKSKEETTAKAVEVEKHFESAAVQKAMPVAVDLVKNLENIEHVTKYVSSKDFEAKTEKLSRDAQALAEKVNEATEKEFGKHLLEMEKSAGAIAASFERLPLKELAALDATDFKAYGLHLAEPLLDADWIKMVAPALEESTKKMTAVPKVYKYENWQPVFQDEIAPTPKAAPEPPADRPTAAASERMRRKQMAEMEMAKTKVVRLNEMQRRTNDSVQLAYHNASESYESSQVAMSRARKQAVIAPYRVRTTPAPSEPPIVYNFSFNGDNRTAVNWQNDNEDDVIVDGNTYSWGASAPSAENEKKCNTVHAKIEKKKTVITFNGKDFSEKIKKMLAYAQEHSDGEWTEEMQQQVEDELQKELKGLEKLEIKTHVVNRRNGSGTTIIIEVETNRD